MKSSQALNEFAGHSLMNAHSGCTKWRKTNFKSDIVYYEGTNDI